MRRVLVSVVLVACSGGDECDEFPPIPVEVTVLDSNGEPVEAAPVDLDGVACTENGGGSYSCEAQPDAAWQLSIVDGRYNAWSEFLEITPTCDAEPFQVTATLGAMMGA